MPHPDDLRWMRRALELAARGRGTASPNPMVGAVVVREGRAAGEGWHERPGTPHAEAMALEAAGEKARGATLYVALEPCNHHGRTPPCTEAILKAGVARVVAATGDTNPLVKGQGLKALQKQGVETEMGVCEDEARRLNEAFFTWTEKGRPFVQLKWASSLDGRIADSFGVSRWLTGEDARRRVHEMRYESDAVLVGRGTAEKDDPLLTIRLPDGRKKPLLRVVLDSRLSLPPTLQLWNTLSDGMVCCAATERSPARRRREMEAQGVEVAVCPALEDGRVDLHNLMLRLAQRGVQKLLVEGGAATLASFIRAGLADRLCVFVAPMILGAKGRPALDEGGEGWNLAGAPRYRLESQEPIGGDVLLQFVPLRERD